MGSVYDVKDFEKEVIEPSFQTAVVVDFWAEWCGPCRILGPVLEELAAKADGTWKLAKVNTETLPDVASRFGIRGIPAVKMFVDGNATNEFVGALPKYQVEYWLQQALPSRFRKEVQAAEALEEGGKGGEAATLLAKVVQEEPENIDARIKLARLILFADPRRAEALVEHLEEPLYSEQIEMILTISRLFKLKENPSSLPTSDAKAVYLKGIASVLRQDFDAALTAFIDSVKSDRYYDDDGPRKACIAIFKFLGEEHEITQKHRREFSSALYV